MQCHVFRTEIKSNPVVGYTRRALKANKQEKIDLIIEDSSHEAKENIENKSDRQFLIERQGGGDLDDLKPVTFTSFQGEIYINEELQPLNQRRILQNNDYIEFRSLNKQLRFLDCRKNEIRTEIPTETKKKYYAEKTIGDGYNGDVRLVYNVWSLEKFALKTISLTSDERTNDGKKIDKRAEVDNEIKIMRKAVHDNVLKLVEVIEGPEKVHLVMEFMDFGDLVQVLKGAHAKCLSEAETKFAMHQVTRGLQHLHKLKISHLDLKLENILVQLKRGEKVYKLCDFGFSVAAEFTASDCGTTNYYPPEIFVEKVEKHSGFKRDMWSLGVVIYTTISGYFPFDKVYGNVGEQIKKGEVKYRHPVWGKISDNAKKVIESLCVVDPPKRLSCDEVLDHPWFNNDETLKARLRNLERVLTAKSRASEELASSVQKKRRVR
jgi:serine/threonine-protein kinase CHEK2